MDAVDAVLGLGGDAGGTGDGGGVADPVQLEGVGGVVGVGVRLDACGVVEQGEGANVEGRVRHGLSPSEPLLGDLILGIARVGVHGRVPWWEEDDLTQDVALRVHLRLRGR